MSVPRSALGLAILLSASFLAAEGRDYPLVGSLSSEDALFRQITSDVEAYHYAQAHRAAGAVPPSLALFRYRPSRQEDLASVAARLNITQATLASLNRLSGPGAFRDRAELLVANIPGVFVPDAPLSDLERDLAASRSASLASSFSVVVLRAGGRVSGRFYPGDDFSPQELLRFYRGYFQSPLRGGRLSSRYGTRVDPFGGTNTFHGGIDIVAPKGTPVAAARAGTVAEIGSSGRYGTYVIVTHESSYQSMYAHLDAVIVALREVVESGKMLGTVGDTGLTTGVHLHFEIRWKGVPVDPLAYLPTDWSRR